MRQEQRLSQSVRHTISDRHTLGKVDSGAEPLESRACAAAGQAGLMALYEAMFAQYGISCAQASSCGSGRSLGMEGEWEWEETGNANLGV